MPPGARSGVRCRNTQQSEIIGAAGRGTGVCPGSGGLLCLQRVNLDQAPPPAESNRHRRRLPMPTSAERATASFEFVKRRPARRWGASAVVRSGFLAPPGGFVLRGNRASVFTTRRSCCNRACLSPERLSPLGGARVRVGQSAAFCIDGICLEKLCWRKYPPFEKQTLSSRGLKPTNNTH